MKTEQNTQLHQKYCEIMNKCVELRKSTKWNLDNMAKSIGISKGALWNYENFKVRPDFLFLEKYARIFNIEIFMLDENVNMRELHFGY